jgi:hypothetical protein
LGVLVAAGVWFPMMFWHGGQLAGPLLLIGGGIAILVLRRPGAETPAPSAAPAPPTGDTTTVEATTVDAPPTMPAPAVLLAPPDAPTAPVETAPAPPASTVPSWPTIADVRADRRVERRARRARPFLGPLTVSALLVAAGVTGLLHALDVIDVNLTAVLAAATCAVGAVLVLSAWVGRARGLIFLGALLLAATAASSVVDVPLRGGIGQVTYRPTQASELRSPYELAIGEMRVDLRALTFPSGVTTVETQQGIGHLEVLVPSSVDLVVEAHIGAGSINVVGQETNGVDRDTDREISGDGSGTLELDIEHGVGRVDVRRFDPRGFETLLGGRP